MQSIREESLYENLMQKLSGKTQPSYQHKCIKEKNYDRIDHTKSEHTMGL